MLKFKAILFDLDGTLLDTLTDIANSMNTVLSRDKLGTYPVQQYRHFVGRGLEHLVKCVLPKEKIKGKIMAEYLSAMKLEYTKRWAETTKPYPLIPDLLDELTKLDLPMAVLSNKSDDFTQIMVRTLLSQWQFNTIRGLKNSAEAKPNPSTALQIAEELNIPPGDFLYLGDSGVDMQTANAAGMYAAGALWGFRTATELKENGAHTLVESPLKVLGLLKL